MGAPLPCTQSHWVGQSFPTLAQIRAGNKRPIPPCTPSFCTCSSSPGHGRSAKDSQFLGVTSESLGVR